jgi:hypothetical protein
VGDEDLAGAVEDLGRGTGGRGLEAVGAGAVDGGGVPSATADTDTTTRALSVGVAGRL